MKFTLSWLKSHLETTATLGEIGAKLTSVGLEVENIEDPGAGLVGLIVAQIAHAKQHPNADRLRLCTVDTGAETIQVVCGAPNARAGLKVVLARPGVTIPSSGEVLKKGSIRGIESQGMLCSMRELKLGEDHDGIIELPADATVGAPVAGVLDFDPVIEINLTPNRVDALGVRGVARDLAAAGLGKLKAINDAPVPGRFVSPRKVKMALPADQAHKCPQFVGRMIRSVKNTESPPWLKARLTAAGLRPISAIVDVTQFLTIDLGRPLHAFDDAKLTGDMGPRLAAPGETLAALNGKTYTLDAEMVVIADQASAAGIGGIMGGEPSSVTETTTSIFLESALFDPRNMSATGRKLQINSDARYCFERGVDPTSPVTGAEIATRMILEICGGEASELIIGGTAPDFSRVIAFNPARVKSLGGVEMPGAEIKSILERLGFGVAAAGEVWKVTPPSWRADVEGWQDLVEEVLRIHGYDNIPPIPLPRAPMPKVALSPQQRQVAFTRRSLAMRGLNETTTWSFLAGAQAELFRGEAPRVAIANPISSDLDVLRPSLIPNLAAAAGRNAARGLHDCGLFEVGPRFEGPKPGQQALVAAALRAGHTAARHWAGNRRVVDALDAKADALAALEAAGAVISALQTASGSGSSGGGGVPAWYHPGRSGVLKLGHQVLAAFGELHPGVLAALDVKGPMVACEVFLERVPQPKKAKAGAARQLLKTSPFQPVERDFAFVVDTSVAADAVLRAVRNAEKDLIAEVGLFDVYEGPHLGEGKKSLAISVTLQPTDATLTDAQIEAAASRIVAAVEKACGGRLRA
ncbi:MAG: phenylalanine--tRNA ligase subunit beta [Rhodospirillaceae bacterium]|nr:phenylalanine--tRNA ligase subunit beta [Rhodospirillaceae bacterium]